MKKSYYVFLLIGVFAGSFVLTGCPPKKKLTVEDAAAEEQIEEAAAEEAEAEAKEPDIEITQDWTEIPVLRDILFSYDAASLGPEQRAVLKDNVAIIKKLPKSVAIRVAGHCDERGTIEYNIALGQRRANVVRSFYKTAGVRGDRLQTISFGEERSLCRERTDDCYKKNRRAVTTVRNPETITVKPGELK